MSKKIVAWVSQHKPLKMQEQALKEKLGNDTQIVRLSKRYENADVIIEILTNLEAKYAVVVLPLTIIKHLLHHPGRNGTVFLKADMIPARDEYNPDSDVLMKADIGMKRHTTFSGYLVYKDIREITEPFEVNKS